MPVFCFSSLAGFLIPVSMFFFLLSYSLMYIFCFCRLVSFLLRDSLFFFLLLYSFSCNVFLSPFVFPHVYILLSLSSKFLTLRFIIFLSPSVLFRVSILLLLFLYNFISLSFDIFSCMHFVLLVQYVCLMALLKYH